MGEPTEGLVGSEPLSVFKNSGRNGRRIKLEGDFSKLFSVAFPPVFLPCPADHVPEELFCMYVCMYGYVCIIYV